MKRYLLLSICVVLALVGAKASNVAFTATDKGEVVDGDSLVASVFDQLFFEAERQFQMRKYDAAYELYTHCLEENPESGAALFRLASLNGVMNQDSIAVGLLERLVKLYPDTYWYRDMLVHFYHSSRMTDKAQAELEKMAEHWNDRADVLMSLMDIYASQADYRNMLRTLDKIETKEGKSEQLSMEKARLYLQLGENETAMKEMQALADEYPNELRYKVLIGDMLSESGKKEEAFETYQSVLQQDSDNVMANLALCAYYDREGKSELFNRQQLKLVANPQMEAATCLQIVHTFVMRDIETHGDSIQMLDLFDKAIGAHPGDVDLMEFKARYMQTRDIDSTLIQQTCAEILRLEPENDYARKRLLYYNIIGENTAGVVSVCRTAVDFGSLDPVYYVYLGMAYSMMDSLKLAVNVYRKGLDKFSPMVFGKSDSQTAVKSELQPLDEVADMYSYLGDLYHRLGNDRLCYQMYDSCLIVRPNDASVLNNYAYYLSLRKQDLKRAETMSRMSNKQEPDNPTYLDTLAWVLYQQKRYAEAKEVMDKVQQLLPADKIRDDSDIIEHIKKIDKKAKTK